MSTVLLHILHLMQELNWTDNTKIMFDMLVWTTEKQNRYFVV